MPDIDALDLNIKKGDSIPFFHFEVRPDEEASEVAGKTIYENVPYVKIISPGNDKEIVNRRVKEADKKRWPQQWAAFQNNEEQEIEGTPIEEWPQVSKAQAATLKASNIFSVENLAEMSDQNLGNLGMGMRTLKNKAIAYLEWQDGEAGVQKYAQRLRRAKERIKVLEEQVAGLEAELEKVKREHDIATREAS